MRLLETHPDWEMSAFSQYQSNVVEYLRDPSIYGEIGLLSKGFVPDDDSASIDFEYLLEKEAESDSGSLSLLVEADKFLKDHLTRDQILVFVERSFRFFEEFFARVQPDVVVSGAVGSLPDMIARQVAVNSDIPYYTFITARLPGRSLLFSGHYTGLKDPITERYESLASQILSAEDIAEAEHFISAVRLREKRATYYNAPSPSDSISALGRWTRRLMLGSSGSAVLNELGVSSFPRNDFGPNTRSSSSITSVIRQGIRGVRRRQLHRRTRRFFHQPTPEEKFVLFPLHQQPEASTSVRAPFFVDQAFIVETLAKSIPVDHCLYVKEHPINVGNVSVEQYERLARIPNVKLIGTDVNTLNLVSRSSLVAVITSSVGWEAMLLNKPVLAFGTSFFNISSLVTKVTDVTELPGLIRKLIGHSPDNSDELRKLVLAALRGTDPGEFDDPFYYPQTLSEENLDRLQKIAEAEFAPNTTSSGDDCSP